MTAEFSRASLPGPRMVIVGVSGSGKTSTARRLAEIYKIPHIELDFLHWQPNWAVQELSVFRRNVEQALSGPSWTCDGNYSKVRDIVWSRSTTLIWLDYTLPVTLWQLTRRTYLRIYRKETLWNGNRENIRNLLFEKDSLFLWAIKSYRKHRQQYPVLLASPEYRHLQVFRFYKRAETSRWLKMLDTVQNPERNRI